MAPLICRWHPFQVLNGEQCPTCDAEIARLEASMKRWDECDEDEVDSNEYARTLHRLVQLRERRDGDFRR